MMYTINKSGLDYYTKWKKETDKGLYLFGPLTFLIFIIFFVGAAGWSIYTWYILVFPLSMVSFFFYFHPLVIRGKEMNAFVKSISFENETIEVKTFEWFSMTSKHLKFEKHNLTMKENSMDLNSFPSNCKLVVHHLGEKKILYLVRDFYDNWEEILYYLKK